MVSFEEIQAAYYMVAATGVLVAAIYYINNVRVAQRNMRHMLETRQIQLFNQFNERFKTERAIFFELLDKWNWKDLNDFWKKYGPDGNPEEWDKFMTIFSHWEQIGLLVRDELIDPKLVWHMVGSFPILLWEKFEPTIIDYREKYEHPPKGMWAEWFEDLYYTLKETRRRDNIDFQARLAKRKKQSEALKNVKTNF